MDSKKIFLKRVGSKHPYFSVYSRRAFSLLHPQSGKSLIPASGKRTLKTEYLRQITNPLSESRSEGYAMTSVQRKPITS